MKIMNWSKNIAGMGRGVKGIEDLLGGIKFGFEEGVSWWLQNMEGDSQICMAHLIPSQSSFLSCLSLILNSQSVEPPCDINDKYGV